MTYSLADAIDATTNLLYGPSRPYRNRLATTVDSDDTAVVCTYDIEGNVGTNSLIAIGLELMYVWAKVDGTKTLTVSRGERGTVAAAHTSGAVIEVNSRFSRPIVALALQEEIRAWEPELFRVADVALSTGAWPGLLDVGPQYDDVYNVLAAKFARTDGTNTTWNDLNVSLVRGLSTADYPSGVGVSVVGPTNQPSIPSSIRVAISLPFDLESIAESSDMVDDVGLARSMCDLAVWGAAIRLLASAEIARTDPTAQGQSRDAAQVKVGDQVNVAGVLQKRYDKRYAEEVAKLRTRYPVRFG